MRCAGGLLSWSASLIPGFVTRHSSFVHVGQPVQVPRVLVEDLAADVVGDAGRQHGVGCVPVPVGVVAREDEKWGEVPIAYVELKPGREASAAEIIEHCRTLLARYKVPKAVIFAEIPKTSTGKIQKFRLREMARQV